jgi:SPRY domain
MASYATFDPSNKSSDITLSNGNLTATRSSGAEGNAYATVVPTTGKWYWELHLDSATDGNFGVGDATNFFNIIAAWSGGNKGAGYLISSTVWYNGSNALAGNTATTGDVLGFALDADIGTLSFYKNNSLVITLNVGTGYGQGQVWVKLTAFYATAQLPASGFVTANFGATTMSYSAPSGYNQGLYTPITISVSDSLTITESIAAMSPVFDTISVSEVVTILVPLYFVSVVSDSQTMVWGVRII